MPVRGRLLIAGLLFIGEPGTGKTHLAVAMLESLIENGFDVSGGIHARIPQGKRRAERERTITVRTLPENRCSNDFPAEISYRWGLFLSTWLRFVHVRRRLTVADDDGAHQAAVGVIQDVGSVLVRIAVRDGIAQFVQLGGPG